VIEIGFVEIRELHQCIEIMNLDMAMLKGDQTLLTQFAQNTIDMDCRLSTLLLR